VAIIGKLFIEGLHKGGVLACGKHFPGHGDTDLDSHVALPMVSHAGERIRSVELHPFIETMKAGLKCIMTAHVVYSAIDAENPATFSSKILTELLRKELKYEGLVITDDMGMAGSMQKSDLPEVCVRAFAAGCDLILISEHHDRQLEAIEALGRAIEKSDALRRRAMESMGRIRRALA
jgi:beta-N-acetylhexosaminidase